MESHGQHTQHEITTQPAAWADALRVLHEHAADLRALVAQGHYDTILFTGCGSPYYLALSAAAAGRELLQRDVVAAPASELWLSPHGTLPATKRTLLVAISRSGLTTELLRACDQFRTRYDGDIVTVSCYPDRPLTTLGTVNIVLPSGQEQSLAQTRAFSTLYLATLTLLGMWSDNGDLIAELEQLPAHGQRLLDTYLALAQSIGRDPTIDRFYFLGSGSRYGLACELSLKMKEMSLSHSEPFHVLEFRHGPKAMVTPSTLVIGLVSEDTQHQEQAVLADMQALGARTLAIGERDADVVFESGLSPVASHPLYLPFGQQLAYEHAMAKGLNPDKLQNLDAVVVLT